MNDGLIPQRYARALYKFALERNNATAVYEEMKQVADSFESAPALQRVMTNPFVDRERKEKLLVSAAGDKVEDDYRRFVKLVLDHNREAYAYCMALDYRRIYRDVNHIAQVVITTAAELPEEEMAKIKGVVSDAFKGYTLEFSSRINPDLIGGFIVDVNSTRMDASISNELEQLRQKLLSSN